MGLLKTIQTTKDFVKSDRKEKWNIIKETSKKGLKATGKGLGKGLGMLGRGVDAFLKKDVPIYKKTRDWMDKRKKDKEKKQKEKDKIEGKKADKKDKDNSKNDSQKESKETDKAEAQEAHLQKQNDIVENNKKDIENFNTENKEEFDKQNKALKDTNAKLDEFEQKLFHSQGGEKTKKKDESKDGEKKDSAGKQLLDGAMGKGKGGLLDTIGSLLGLGAGTALSYGLLKGDEAIHKKADEETDSKIEKKKEEIDEIKGEISQEDKEYLSPDELKDLQKTNTNIKDEKGNPHYLKENANGQKEVSNYVNQIMNGNGNIEEKEAILAELKKRNDVSPEQITKLENHISQIKQGNVNNVNVKTGNININANQSSTQLKADANAPKELKNDNQSLETQLKDQNKELQKSQVEANKQTDIINNIENDNANQNKKTETIAGKPQTKKDIFSNTKDEGTSGETDNRSWFEKMRDWFSGFFGGQNQNQQSGTPQSPQAPGIPSATDMSGGGTASAPAPADSSGSVASGGGGANAGLPQNACPPGSKDCIPGQAQKAGPKDSSEVVSQSQAETEDREGKVTNTPPSPAPTPSNLTAGLQTAQKSDTQGVALNSTSKNLANQTTPGQKPNIVNKEKVIENTITKAAPPDTWDEFKVKKPKI